MDNITHSLVGAALAEAGPRDRVVLATPTLILAANVPDLDILSYFAGEYAALAFRRGITHGVPMLVVWPFIVAGIMLAWDRLVRRRREPDAAPASCQPLVVLAAIGVLTHPALDWLNTYGMRWWLPFDGAWSYGDGVFIVDPWLWLGLGGVVFLARSRGRSAILAWAGLAALTSLLVLLVPIVPFGAKAVWVAGLSAFVAARTLRPFRDHVAPRRRAARVAIVTAGAYIALMLGASAAAERGAWAAAIDRGLQPVDVMAGPMPANPFDREIVIRTPAAYHFGRWRWRDGGRLALAGAPLPARVGPGAVIDAAVRNVEARHFLTWSRYPYVHAFEDGAEWRVRVGDVRYRGRGGLGGLEVRVPR